MTERRIKALSEAENLRMVISRGVNKGRVFPLEEGTNLIGRWDVEASAFPEIDLDDEDTDAKISRKHAIIHCTNGSVSIEDLGSLNGTFVDRGRKLKEGEVYELSPGDEIIIGKIFLQLEQNVPGHETISPPRFDSEGV